MSKYLTKSVDTLQGHLNQARKNQYQHKYQSQWILATHKFIFYLKHWWMQENYNPTKQVVLQSHTAGE